jgi:uncharacterized protein (TIGR03032 family)
VEKAPLPDPTGRWEEHDRDWRDPAQVASGWREASSVDPALLRFRQRGAFWDVLDELGICLLVGREYEHLLIGLTVASGRPRISFFPLPHPSGIAIDRTAGREQVFVASTRNPNQVYEFMPVTGALTRRDVEVVPPAERPLVPVASTFYPGALYLHDLAFVGGRLHANAVGQNAVVRLDGRGSSTRVWWPKCVETADGPEFGLNHIQLNSIAAGRSVRESYFTASTDELSRRRPGHRSFRVDRRGVVFSGRTREPVIRGLTRPHSARLDAGERLWVDDSGYGEVGVARDGRFEAVARLPGWTRGLALAGSVAFVGTSRVLPRFRSYAPGLDVDSSTCAVHAVDTGSGKVLGSVAWPQGNQIFGVEWLSREATLGWPFLIGRPSLHRARELFYTFQTGGSEGGR